MKVFNKMLIIVLMILSASARAMDPVKTTAEFNALTTSQTIATIPQVNAKKKVDQDRLNELLRQEVAGDCRLAEVRSLLERGAQPNTQDLLGRIPLIQAIRAKNFSVVDELIKQGASVHVKDIKNNSALSYALFKDPYDKKDSFAEKEDEKKDAFNIQSPKNDWNKYKDHICPEMVDLLLKNGAICCDKNDCGVSPMAWLTKRSPANFGALYKAFLRSRMCCVSSTSHQIVSKGEYSSDYACNLQDIFNMIILAMTAEHSARLRKARSFSKARVRIPAQSIEMEPATDPELIYDAFCAGADMVPKETVKPTVFKEKSEWDSGSDDDENPCAAQGPYSKILALSNNSLDSSVQGLAMFEKFQAEHKKTMKDALPGIFPTALYSLIYECLYIRPEVGVMPAHFKDLLMAPNYDQRAIDLIERYVNLGGDVNATDVPIAADDKSQHAATAITPIQKSVKSKRTIYNPLLLAIQSGNSKIVKLLEKNDAHLPGNRNNEACEKWLLAHNAGYAKIADGYHTSMINLMYKIVVSDEMQEMLADFFNRGMPINIVSKGDHRNLLLHILYASSLTTSRDNPSFLNKVKFLIERGIDLNQVGTYRKKAALQLAVEDELVDVVKLLLYMGAQDDHADANGKTLWETTEHELIKQLLKKPSEINIYLTDDELKEFADIKAERERALATMKVQNMTAAAV